MDNNVANTEVAENTESLQENKPAHVVTIKEILGFDVGKIIPITGVLKEIKNGITTENKAFVDGTISDKTSSIRFKIWDTNLENLQSLLKKEFVAGQVISIKGTLTEFKNSKFMKINVEKGKPLIRVVDSLSASDFEVSIPLPAEKVFESLLKAIEEIPEEHEIRNITKSLFLSLKDIFKNLPLDKDVHYEKGGMLFHIWNVGLRIKRAVVPILPDGSEYNIDTDTMLCALILYNYNHIEHWQYDESFNITQWGEVNNALYGNIGTFETLVKMIPAEKRNHPCVQNFLHMILCLTLGLKPATIEAEFLVKFVNEEKETFKMLNILNNAECGVLLGKKYVRL